MGTTILVGLETACGAGTLEVMQPASPVTMACDAGSVAGQPDAALPDGGDARDAGAILQSSDAGLSADAGPSADAGMDRPAPSCASLTALLGSAWSRGPYTRFSEVPSINYAGSFLNPFPVTGSFGRFVTRDDEYLAIEFDTPTGLTSWTALQRFDWGESQVGGAAITSAVYITVSTCPGDFRIPGPEDAPANDPTFARGCRSVRERGGFPLAPQSNLPYVVGTAPSTADVCRLAPGRRYFLNFIRANAVDGSIGSPQQEARCSNPDLSSCGVQLRAD